MRHVPTRAFRKAAPPEHPQKIQEERRRIAERIVQALREAGYSCEPGSRDEASGDLVGSPSASPRQ